MEGGRYGGVKVLSKKTGNDNNFQNDRMGPESIHCLYEFRDVKIKTSLIRIRKKYLDVTDICFPDYLAIIINMGFTIVALVIGELDYF